MNKIWGAIAGFLNLLGFRADEWFTTQAVKPENIRASLAQAEEQEFSRADQAEKYAAQYGSAVDEMSANLVDLQSHARAAAAKADQNMKLAAQYKGKDPAKEQVYYGEAAQWQKSATQYEQQVQAYSAKLAARAQSLTQAKAIALSFYSTALRKKSDDAFEVADAVMNALDRQCNNQLRGELGLMRGQSGADIRSKLHAQIQKDASYNKHDADLLTEMAKMAGVAQYAGADAGLSEADQTALQALKAKYGYTPSSEEAPADSAKSGTAS